MVLFSGLFSSDTIILDTSYFETYILRTNLWQFRNVAMNLVLSQCADNFGNFFQRHVGCVSNSKEASQNTHSKKSQKSKNSHWGHIVL